MSKPGGIVVEVAASKTPKWATRESGDTLEMIERPNGGLSFVLVDGQWTGHGAKAVSHLVARKAISLLAEGVRDGAAARAAHDYLYTARRGRVSATLNILSVDLASGTVVISRNNACPVVVVRGDACHVYDEPSRPVGIERRTRPQVLEEPLEAGTLYVVFTDGLASAGERYGERLDVLGEVRRLRSAGVQEVCQGLLDRALALDRGRASDDMSVMALEVRPDRGERRQLHVRFPLT